MPVECWIIRDPDSVGECFKHPSLTILLQKDGKWEYGVDGLALGEDLAGICGINHGVKFPSYQA